MQLDLQLAFIGGVSHWELIIILVIALLIFGSRLPKVMRSLGQSVTEFKRGMNEITTDESQPGQEAPKKDAKDEPAAKDESAAV